MISQDFMGEHRSICRYGGHWMNFPSGENPSFVIVTDVAERVLSCVMRVEETLARNRFSFFERRPGSPGRMQACEHTASESAN
jgi:hypothetical protein